MDECIKEYSDYIIGFGFTLLMSLCTNMYLYCTKDSYYEIRDDKYDIETETERNNTINVNPMLKSTETMTDTIKLPETAEKYCQTKKMKSNIKSKNTKKHITLELTEISSNRKEKNKINNNTNFNFDDSNIPAFNEKIIKYYPPYSIKSDIPDWARQEYLEKIV